MDGMQDGPHLYCLSFHIPGVLGTGDVTFYKIGSATGNFFVPQKRESLKIYLDRFPSKKDRKDARIYKVVEGIGYAAIASLELGIEHKGKHHRKHALETNCPKGYVMWVIKMPDERVAEDLESVVRLAAGEGLTRNWPGQLNAHSHRNIAPTEWFVVPSDYGDKKQQLADIKTLEDLEKFVGMRFVKVRYAKLATASLPDGVEDHGTYISTYQYENLKDTEIKRLKEEIDMLKEDIAMLKNIEKQ